MSHQYNEVKSHLDHSGEQIMKMMKTCNNDQSAYEQILENY